jgi:hypothetical protein
LSHDQPVFEVSSAWKAAYPDAYAGILVMREVANPRQSSQRPEMYSSRFMRQPESRQKQSASILKISARRGSITWSR